MPALLNRTLVAASVVVALSGCATIFNSESQAVKVHSAPEGAAVVIANSSGEKVHTGTTPFTVTLKRGAGYFKPESYTLTFTKDGFPTREVKIEGTISGWYFGNLLLGGIIGMLAVDPVTGAMYALPESVTGTMADQPAKPDAPKTSQLAPSLTVVSTHTLTPQQMAQAQLVVPGR